VLQALADGLHSKEIALLLRRTKPTVEGYVRQLCIKFEARSRAHLVAKALAEGALQYRLADDSRVSGGFQSSSPWSKRHVYDQ
jgi:hypothetical protein